MSFIQDQVTHSVKGLVRIALWCYFKEIRVKGYSSQLKNGATIFMGNHQNALLDALLVATTTRRKTTFLTRSDVFKNPLLGSFLRYIGMLPIYRFRDGLDTKLMNEPIFKKCGTVLDNQEALLIFPEGNHGLKRTVRPIKKGFISILLSRWALDTQPVNLAPIGLNYINLVQFPDRVSVVYGTELEVQAFDQTSKQTKALLDKVHASLAKLTTHIPEQYEAHYNQINAILENQADVLLDPKKSNSLVSKAISLWPLNVGEMKTTPLEAIPNTAKENATQKARKRYTKGGRLIFIGLNIVPILLWRVWLKPTIRQAEFISTARFGFSLIFFPLYFLAIFSVLLMGLNHIGMALAIPMFHFILNIVFVKKIL